MSEAYDTRGAFSSFSATSDDLVQVMVLNDGFAAALYVPEDSGRFPSVKQVHLAIEKAKINFGINEKAVNKFVKEQIRGKGLIFAKGSTPGDGISARLVWNNISEDGAAPQDITEQLLANSIMHIFSVVKEGDQILSKLPATSGLMGTNIFSDEVQVGGKDIAMPEGEGTELSSDGLMLLAKRKGVAHWDADRVTVTEMEMIEGDIDVKTGDVKADGNIYIRNDVTEGLRLEAMGDIFIGGSIIGADVYSRSGSVRVHKGIIGQSRARILAGANVVAEYIQDATVGAKENVEVQRRIINSAVTSGRFVTVMTNEGLIRGGNIYAEKKIELLVAGSENRSITELKVGFSSAQAHTKEKYQLKADQKRTQMELAYVQKRLAFLKILKERMGSLTEDKEIQFRKLRKKEHLLRHESRRHDNLESDMERLSRGHGEEEIEAESIRVHKTIYTEVTLGIGDATMVMNKERHNLLIYRAGDMISFGPLEQAMRG
ncbi:MAG: DUF342 domain-containing protein [Candidatus Marinimicrobia bacterium]|nr:DUF342 domain-containing protein [Candidatus Neomarinimicrobiota bacterium]